jgi:hypothetical protein
MQSKPALTSIGQASAPDPHNAQIDRLKAEIAARQ